MKNLRKKITAAAFIFTLLLVSAAPPASALAAQADTGVLNGILAAYAQKNLPSDWETLVLALNGKELPKDYLKNLEDTVKRKKGTFALTTDYARIVLIYRASGRSPANIAGYDFAARLYNAKSLTKQGGNGAIWALIALSGDMRIPAGAKWQTTTLCQEVLKYQKSDGGFALTAKSASETDLTAMAIVALSPYQADAVVSKALESALSFLLAQQKKDGFATNDAVTCESTAQAVMALCALGKSPADSAYQKNGKTLPQQLDAFRVSATAYEHTAKGGANTVATQQAALALTALARYEAAQGPVTVYVKTPTAKLK